MRLFRTFLLTLALASPAVADTRPNIVLIMADDLGIEGLSCYGSETYDTPNLDRLAAEGLRFTHAYSQPLCTPTRVQLMTGKYNHRNWTYFGILDPEERTFGHHMQEAGYQTGIFGKWQLQSYDPPDLPGAEKRRGKGMKVAEAGFDEWALFHAWETEDKGSRYADPKMDHNGEIKTYDGKYGEDIWVDQIGDFLERQKDADEPMFVYYPMALPHWPFNPTPDSTDWKDESKRLDEDEKYFPDMVHYMDKVVGRLIEKIDSLGLAEETLILFYSDNGTDSRVTSVMDGTSIPGGKNKTFQTGIRVPLIARWPGKIAPGTTDGDLVDASDFFPTLGELAEADFPKLDGQSFLPQLMGAAHPNPREWSFFWYDPRPGWDKEKFSREVFALDKAYKLFRDGRMYSLHDTLPIETKIDEMPVEVKAKLQGVIDAQLSDGEPPLVDSHGNLIE